MKDFRIERETRGKVELLRLSGSLDMYSFPRLETQINSLFEEQHYALLLDCHDLDYIGSAGLGALIGFSKLAREKGGDVRLFRVPERIFKIIELLGFTKVLQVHPDEASALASFGNG
jgi:anti-sigma B factor antagonist